DRSRGADALRGPPAVHATDRRVTPRVPPGDGSHPSDTRPSRCHRTPDHRRPALPRGAHVVSHAPAVPPCRPTHVHSSHHWRAHHLRVTVAGGPRGCAGPALVIPRRIAHGCVCVPS